MQIYFLLLHLKFNIIIKYFISSEQALDYINLFGTSFPRCQNFRILHVAVNMATKFRLLYHKLQPCRILHTTDKCNHQDLFRSIMLFTTLQNSAWYSSKDKFDNQIQVAASCLLQPCRILHFTDKPGDQDHAAVSCLYIVNFKFTMVNGAYLQ